jgi:hypothetical protein
LPRLQKKIKGILLILTAGFGDRGNGGGGARCRATGDAGNSEGGEQRVWCRETEEGVRFIGLGGGGEEGRRPAAVEFYSSSVSKELNGEEETRRR